MTVEVNLLPAQYRDGLRRRLWLRRGAAVAAIVIAAELSTGLALHLMGQSQRNISQDLVLTRKQSQTQHQELSELNRQAELVRRDLHLATELRASHAWSRLLATIAETTPAGVVLSHVATDPPKWAAAPVEAASLSKVNSRTTPEKERNTQPAVIAASLRGLTIRGRAGDHEKLSLFMTGLHELKLFRTLELQRMQREQLGGLDAVSFDLQGQW